MGEQTQRNRIGLKRGTFSTGRVLSFSDAVFAVAITLLILNIDVPEIPERLVDSKLPSELAALWPKFFAFFLSFVIIGAFWIFHHRMMEHIERQDTIFRWLNILLLMFVVLMPFSSSLISEYSDSRIAVTFYACNWIVINILFALMWWYSSSSRRLVSADFNPDLARHAILSYLTTILVLVVSVFISIFNPVAAKYFWLVLFPAHTALGRIYAKRVKSGG